MCLGASTSVRDPHPRPIVTWTLCLLPLDQTPFIKQLGCFMGCSLPAASWNCWMKEPIGAWSPMVGLGGVQQHPTSNPKEVEKQPLGLGGTRFLRSSHSLIAAKRVPAARRHDMKVPTLPGWPVMGK